MNNNIKKILVVIPVEEEHKAEIINAAQGAEVIFEQCDGNVTDEELGDMDIIIGNISEERLKYAKKLKWIQLNSAGVEPYIKEGVLPKGALLTNSTGAYGLAISEHMIGMLLSLFKKLNLYRDNQNQGLWKDEGNVKSIYGSTILVVGLGDIGGEFAKRVKALGAYTIGVRRVNAEKPDYLDEIHLTEDIDKLLPRVDVVALSLPGTKATYKMFSKEKFELMKDGAVLLNVGRGTTVDTDDLCSALESGKLSGCGLDVTDPEPLPSDHRLWKMKNAVITPHISGDFHLRQTHDRIVRIASDNLKRYINGEELNGVVDFTTGYMKSSK